MNNDEMKSKFEELRWERAFATNELNAQRELEHSAKEWQTYLKNKIEQLDQKMENLSKDSKQLIKEIKK